MKKSIIMIIIVALCNMTVLPLSPQEMRSIRKDLYSQYANGVLTNAQLFEQGMTVQEVIDRDLQIMIEHREVLQKKLDSYKGFFVQTLVPAANKFTAFVTGALSSATGAFAYSGFDWVNKTWKRGDFQSECEDIALSWKGSFLDIGSYFGKCTKEDVMQYNEEVMQSKIQKIQRMEQQNLGFKEVALLAPVAACVSAVTGLLCIVSIYELCTYKGKIAASLQKIQKRFDRDQTIIVQLKQMKYQLA